MSCCSILGRILLAVIYIGAGVAKFQNPGESAGFLNARYPAFYNQVSALAKQYQVPVPEQLAPNFIKQHSTNIIYGVGGAEVLLGLFVILGQGWAGSLLSLLTLSFVAVIHNPYLHGSTPSEKLGEQIQGLWTLGLAGALLLVGSKSAGKCAVTATPATSSKKGKTAPTGKAKTK